MRCSTCVKGMRKLTQAPNASRPQSCAQDGGVPVAQNGRMVASVQMAESSIASVTPVVADRSVPDRSQPWKIAPVRSKPRKS